VLLSDQRYFEHITTTTTTIPILQGEAIGLYSNFKTEIYTSSDFVSYIDKDLILISNFDIEIVLESDF